ncbi:hypothetical protein KQ306_08820 [Synechococcus sp. CS-1324]|uniref:hypothetical protein n=1 Tax=Synechococcus sp. CS-1324 TaxID=2847980 RepID=UPI000DB0230D|nr:hypothetical protein [Synechococcus sp. CS-1324]MCT0230950.1 hypothetical protein [Synechococcus sp. CS-1324]PZV04197.1 MAG: hypothetical protein DCF23_07165 [Cyanobium sp.]
MASLSRKIRLQQLSWQLLEDLAICGERIPRLATLAAEVLFEQQCQRPAAPADPELEALLPW